MLSTRILEALPAPDEPTLARALAEVRARSVRYPLGSGQADEVALLAGLRPAVRQLLGSVDLDAAVDRFERLGLACEVAPRTYGPTRDGWDDTPEPLATTDPRARRALWVGRDRGRLAAAVACDLAKTDEADRELGRLLGYPRCCVDAFIATSSERRNDELVRAAVLATRGRPAPRLNTLDLAVFHFVSWHPCSYDCALSLRYADAVAGAVGARWSEFVRTMDELLAVHRLFFTDDVQLDLGGTIEGGVVRVRRILPTSRVRHPDASLEADAELALVRLLIALRGSTTIETKSLGLVVDGREIAFPMSPILAAFGEWERT